MIDVIGYWMALTLLVLPPFYWICVVCERCLRNYLLCLTKGRFVLKVNLVNLLDKYPTGLLDFMVFMSAAYGFFWVLGSLVCSVVGRSDKYIEWHTTIATNLTWIFYPIMVGTTLLFLHKILKKVVDFGYRVHDKLEKES